jgi:lipopolysaccharide/colanic/teichoic acid biosynthesis glycosyltransferase
MRSESTAGARKHGIYPSVKRGLDIVFSLLLLILLSPVLAIAAVAVRVKLGRPILFRQARPGLNSRIFTLVKFRTMALAPEGVSTELDGVRLSSFGSRLRSTSIDELPTLWNVFSGDMSFVGPRPLLVKYLDEYTPEQAQRHLVRPGITGLAQASGRNALSWEERFALDIYYVNNCSFRLDASILVKTVTQVFQRSGISSTGHATMYEFKSGRDNG